MAREEAAAAEEEEDAAAAPMLVEVIWPLLGALGCRGGGDPFVGVELSEERPESSRPSSAPPPTTFSRLAGTRTRVGRPVVRLRAPFNFSIDEEAILARSSLNRIVGHLAAIARGSSAAKRGSRVSWRTLSARTLSSLRDVGTLDVDLRKMLRKTLRRMFGRTLRQEDDPSVSLWRRISSNFLAGSSTIALTVSPNVTVRR